MNLPVVHLSGSPYEQGRAHGEALRERIAHNLAVYFDRFEREAKLPRAEVLARARLYGAAITKESPHYHDAMRGVSDGCGAGLDEITALNVRYEILYYQFGVLALEGAARPEPDGCTAFALLPDASANGHLLLGQNWDWIPQVRGAVLHTTEADGLETLAFTEAGIVGGKIGLNSAGLGLAINGMTTTLDDWSRLRKPFHVRCHEVLRRRTVDEAVGVVTEGERNCSANFLIAQSPDFVADIEAAPDRFRRLSCARGTLVHTNHFLDPERLGVVEPPSERRPHSFHRRSRFTERITAGSPIRVSDLQAALRDHEGHPYSVCRHEAWDEPPEERYITVTSVVMDLAERAMLLSDGPPCENPYERIAF